MKEQTADDPMDRIVEGVTREASTDDIMKRLLRLRQELGKNLEFSIRVNRFLAGAEDLEPQAEAGKDIIGFFEGVSNDLDRMIFIVMQANAMLKHVLVLMGFEDVSKE